MKKLQAGSLQYVLVISIVISILIFSLISLIFIYRKFESRNNFYRLAISNSYQGFNYLNFYDLEYYKPIQIQLTSYEVERTILEKRPWGIYEIGIITSTFQNEISKKAAILGYRRSDKLSIYTPDDNQPLVLVGDTQIKGDAHLSSRGLKEGNIAGISYYNSRLIDGDINESGSNLPDFKGVQNLKKLLQLDFDGYYENYTLKINDSINQSFFKPTKIIQTNYPLILENIFLKGNVVISSNSEIIATSQAILEDIVLIAPRVRVLEGFNGNVQIISSSSIKIDSNVKLSYPSSLTLLNAKSSSTEKTIHIEDNSQVFGSIVYLNEHNNSEDNSNIYLAENSLVKGEVYCSNNTEARGTVIGSIYTNNFLVKEEGRVYRNYLLNSTIDALSLTEKFVGLALKKDKVEIAKWVQ